MLTHWEKHNYAKGGDHTLAKAVPEIISEEMTYNKNKRQSSPAPFDDDNNSLIIIMIIMHAFT